MSVLNTVIERLFGKRENAERLAAYRSLVRITDVYLKEHVKPIRDYSLMKTDRNRMREIIEDIDKMETAAEGYKMPRYTIHKRLK